MSKVSPQRYGKYVLLRKIALGGMAEIFKAKVAGAEGFEKDLVIKRILPQFSEDEAFVQMFVDEARITAKLQHQNIVQIYDFDVVDESYYIAMEYIEGKDLKDVLEAGIKQRDPLSVAQCVWIAIEVSKGLHYAHTKEDKGVPLNIVHRDVTPSNVMLSFRGDVKLMDFGIAKAAQRSTKTQAGAVKGKVAYMSPEQARGKPIDGRSDLFALGVMLWEMLTRRRLFLADSDFETLSKVLKMEAPAPSSINKEVPKDLDPIVLKALAKDPNARFADVEAFGRELTRWYYSSVIDIEKEKLRPLLSRLFEAEIDANARAAAEDDQLVRGGASPAARGGSSPAVRAAPSPAARGGSSPAARAAPPAPPRDLHNEATMMMQAADDEDEPPASEQQTRMNMAAMEGGTTVGVIADDRPAPRTPTRTAQRPRPATQTASVAFHGGVAGQRKRSALPWVVLAIVLVLGGGAAALLASSGG
ncbi:MAG: protein kinase [Deltaproteobacteria bacterium]|nr:protein kinase [Deltaproteobacteria bacterium]